MQNYPAYTVCTNVCIKLENLFVQCNYIESNTTGSEYPKAKVNSYIDPMQVQTILIPTTVWVQNTKISLALSRTGKWQLSDTPSKEVKDSLPLYPQKYRIFCIPHSQTNDVKNCHSEGHKLSMDSV